MKAGQATLAESIRRILLAIAFLAASFTTLCGEILPVKTYTTADGLLRDTANCIKQDSRGFLWFCTSDGLSRFDGYGFVSYTTEDGLPHRSITDFLETRSGVYWVATRNGLARFHPTGTRGAEVGNEPMFTAFKPADNSEAREISVLFEDSHGGLWCGTSDGLYKIETKDRQVIFHRIELGKDRQNVPLTVSSIIEDKRGNIWIGMDLDQGLNRITPDGRVEHFRTERGKKKNESITTLVETKDGEIWAGMSIDGGLCSLVAEPTLQGSIFSRCFSKHEGLPGNWIFSLYQTSDGKLWIGTTDGGATLDANSQLRIYKEPQGLCDKSINRFEEDRDGNLWASTDCGIKRITRSGFVRFNESDGLGKGGVNGIISTRNGELFVITKSHLAGENPKDLDVHAINRFDKDRFTEVMPRLPLGVSTGWGGGQIVVEDRAGNWWLPSGDGAVYRFAEAKTFERLADEKPQVIAIPDSVVFRLYEDSRSDIWISTMSGGHLLKWERATQNLTDYQNETTTVNITRHANCFVEDKDRVLWISSEYTDDLLRYKDGRFQIVKIRSERPIGNVNTLYFDHVGRLWMATSLNGIGRVDDTKGDELNVVWYNRKSGLATDGTRGLVEDNFGRIYVGHGRGIDRINPSTGQIKHYTAADGLPQGANVFIARDREGALWFGNQGLARLIPEADKPRLAPNILLTGLRIAGERQNIPELGEVSLPSLDLNSNQTQVSIDFLALAASLGEELKYQYKLENATNDWIETEQRTVNFANLAPGSYRFLVRAVTFDGLISQNPASLSFTIAAPIWKRWWFISLAILTIGGLAFVVYRYRVNRLLELERVRSRIATDLHDDIGSNLSKISILSEVARQQYEPDGNAGVPPAPSPTARSTGDAETPLSSIANISRESVAAMSDIVWAINPRKDSLIDLTSRMRRFAEDTLESCNITLDFVPPDAAREMKLGADARRAVYLIFKECINNIARHSGATTATIDLRIEARELMLTISDNGKGFDATREYEGNGLVSIRRRAEEFGGDLKIVSATHRGTEVMLSMPLTAREKFAPRR